MAIRTVLLPLDGSEFSRQIVRVVRTFISPDGVELVLFRAAQPPPGGPHAIPTERIPGTSRGRRLVRGVQSCRRRRIRRSDARARWSICVRSRRNLPRMRRCCGARGTRCGRRSSTERPAQRIIEFVNAHHVDLVAMTTHGRSGLGRLVLGSVAERVVRGVSVPVLLMRSAPDGREKAGRDKMLTKALRRRTAISCGLPRRPTVPRCRSGRWPWRVGSWRRWTRSSILLVVASEKDSVDHGQKLMEEATQQVAGLMPRPRHHSARRLRG